MKLLAGKRVILMWRFDNNMSYLFLREVLQASTDLQGRRGGGGNSDLLLRPALFW